MRECTRAQAERLGEAIRFRTVTLLSEHPGAEPGYAPFAALLEYLRGAFPLAAASLRWESFGDLALLLTWASSPSDAAAPALLLYAHFDVVPPGDEAAWSHGAFSGDVEDGFIWGRGALDDKNCLMGIMEAVEGLLADGFLPCSTVYLAFGGDEETTGFFGARCIAEALAARGVRLSCVLDEGSIISDGILPSISRPVAMVAIAEKGFANVEIIVHGRAGHSAMPGRGTTAGALAAVVGRVERRRFPARLTPVVARFFRAVAPHAPGPLGLGLRLLRPLWPLLRGALAADPWVDSLLRTTQAVTILRAGEKENVLPETARAVVNVRLLPGDTPQSALIHVEKAARRAVKRGFTLEVRFLPGATASDPVPETRPSRELWAVLEDAVREVEPRAIVAPFLGVVYTDSRKFASITDAIVRLHPVVLTRGELGRIHAADERISLENYGRMIAFYARVIGGISGRSRRQPGCRMRFRPP